MKKLSILALGVLPLVALSQPALAQTGERAGERIANSYICVFARGTVSRGNAQAEATRAAQAAGGQVTRVYSVALQGFAVNASAQAVEQMRAANRNIAYCEQDQVVTLPPYQQAGQPTSGEITAQSTQETPWGIARVNGGAAGTYATAWVIDTGIDLDHPDLRVDVTRSRSFVDRETADDLNGHGSHVAGTIGALDNTFGVIGVAPGAPVVAVKVLNRRGSGTISGVIAGVDYVGQYGRSGDVANMSLGGGASQALDDAVLGASAGGVRFAIAAGNDSANANNYSPARVNGPNIFTVSAFAIGDKWASYSNFGNPPIDYSEPGSSIKSTWKGGGYNTISGTSMATPHLAGLLLTGGLRTDSVVIGDPDGNPDPIGER